MRRKVLSFLLISFFLLSSCNSINNKETITGDNKNKSETNDSPENDNNLNADSSSENKTISVSVIGEYFINSIASEFEAVYRDIEVVVHHYDDSEIDKFIEKTNIALMTGQADDVIESNIAFNQISNVGLLTDLNELMANDKEFNPDDYYMNIIKLNEYKGKLFSFPISFALDILSINKNAPKDVIAKFEAIDRVSFPEAIDLFNNTEKANDLNFEQSFSPQYMIRAEIKNYIDFDKKECDFNNEKFINLLNTYKNALAPNELDEIHILSLYNYWTSDKALSEAYFFTGNEYLYFQYILPYENNFVGAKPLSNSNGDIQATINEQYSIPSSSKNKETAWNYIKYLQSRKVRLIKRSNYAQLPINKNVFQFILDFEFKNSILASSDFNMFLEGDEGELAKNAVDLLDSFVQKVSYSGDTGFDFNDIIDEEYMNFLRGIITDKQAAENIQNKISIKLME